MTKEEFLKDISLRMHIFLSDITDDVALFIACQFALESNFGCSALALRYNNYCGMKQPCSRLTSSIADDDKSEFAHYLSITDCVVDYVLWLQFNRFTRKKIQHLGDFKLLLAQSGFCPEKTYIERIENIYNQYSNLLNIK